MVTLEDRVVTVPPGVVLDLGATAKAIAADRCADRVHRATGSGVLINLGGDIATAGAAPDGGWQVLVHDAADDPASSVALPSGSRAGHVEHDSPSVALRRGRGAPHPRPADGVVGRSGVAHGERRRTKPVWPPTRSARPPSSAVGARWIGFVHLTFPPDWWTATAVSTPSADGRPRQTEQRQ